MKMPLTVAILLGIILVAPGAPNATPEQTPPLNPNEARNYAEHLTHVIYLIANNYVRPIPRSRLYHAALAAVYQQAGKAVPANLAGELARVLQELPDDAEESEAASKPTTPGDLPVIELVARQRQDIGDLEALRGNGALRVSVEAMIQTLDPHCGLVSSEDLRRSRGENLNSGFGFTWSPDSTAEELRVASVAIGGPAQRAGVRPGDKLTQLRFNPARFQRQPLPPIGLPGLLALAQPGDPLGCTLERTGKPLMLDFQHFQAEAVLGVRRQDDDCWNYWLDREEKIGYVRVGSLEHGTADQLADVVGRLDHDGLRGLILDLRWSPGGYLNEAVLVSRLFISDALVATIRCRNRQDDQEYRAKSEEAYTDFPIIVLINGETSGGAELIAAALQDDGRAKVAGQRTKGKASVQSTFPLPLGDTGLKLTTGQFFRPNGKPLQRQPNSRPADHWGVRPEPDLELPLTSDLCDQLRDAWLLFSIRPGASKEVLFLDDPENDPQRQEALRAMIDLVNK